MRSSSPLVLRPAPGQRIPLRPDVPPDDATIVLRAGVMSADNVTRAAERTFAFYAVYGISVEGVINTTVQEACRGDRISS